MRVAAAVLSISLVGVTLSPLLRDPTDDGYPLSTYPMFAFRRPTMLTMDYARGVRRTGGLRVIRPWHVGSAEVLQARAILERGVAGGRKAQALLCLQIAARVASDPEYADVVEIKLVTGTHEAVDYLVRHSGGTELTRATCKVRR